MKNYVPVLLVFVLALGFPPIFAGLYESDEGGSKAQVTRISDSNPLKPLNALIGEWRGVGQLKRGSREGAWSEKVTCEWHFENGTQSILLKTEDGSQFEKLVIAGDAEQKSIILKQTLKNVTRTYRGPAPKSWPDRIELVSESDDQGVSYRCTIQQLSDIRATILFEQRSSATGSFRRVAGVGYTRAGEKLAVSGGNERKCIVTGGLGTIPVTYMGKTYYVCCQGCVQAFNDAPEAIIADYQASLKEVAPK